MVKLVESLFKLDGYFILNTILIQIRIFSEEMVALEGASTIHQLDSLYIGLKSYQLKKVITSDQSEK